MKVMDATAAAPCVCAMLLDREGGRGATRRVKVTDAVMAMTVA